MRAIRRRPRDRAPDPAPRPPAGARAAFGAARGAASHQEARARCSAPLARRHAGRERAHRRLLDLRQRRHRRSLHDLPRPAPRPSIIVVVEDVSDLWALERSGAVSARYHVLGGVLSPLDGVRPEHLNLDALVARAAEPGGRRRSSWRSTPPSTARPPPITSPSCSAHLPVQGDQARPRRAGRRRTRLSRRRHAVGRDPPAHRLLKHDPEKWLPVFGKDHAQTKTQSGMTTSKRSHRALAVAPALEVRGDEGVVGEVGVARGRRGRSPAAWPGLRLSSGSRHQMPSSRPWRRSTSWQPGDAAGESRWRRRRRRCCSR